LRSSSRPPSRYGRPMRMPARPFLVVIRRRRRASVPYIVAADGPFTISMLSMLRALMSPRRLSHCRPCRTTWSRCSTHANAVEDEMGRSRGSSCCCRAREYVPEPVCVPCCTITTAARREKEEMVRTGRNRGERRDRKFFDGGADFHARAVHSPWGHSTAPERSLRPTCDHGEGESRGFFCCFFCLFFCVFFCSVCRRECAPTFSVGVAGRGSATSDVPAGTRNEVELARSG